MYKALIDRLEKDNDLTAREYLTLFRSREEIRGYAAERAVSVRKKYYGSKVYLRALIEFSNYCRNNCFYCGIRAGNSKAVRYRLSADEILSCAEEGYTLGFRTFVLQGGESNRPIPTARSRSLSEKEALKATRR